MKNTIFACLITLRKVRIRSTGTTDWMTVVQFKAGPMTGFLYAATSRPDIGPTRPPVEMASGTLSPDSKAAGT